jgi:acetyl-CoA carboxylase/biotin carboxylase 1
LRAKDITPDKRAELLQKLNERYEALAPIYHQISVQFADLHDTAGRMKFKGVIVDVIPWKKVINVFI